ncbi:MAG: 50S ribosomal protein L3 [Candidatus Thermoplasmatota archaeon]|nr:50S ribosomal protein L3 [Euryarchaeota archaeon]MBU4031946.1 50S ribosomal protein L3 [Candidatus Thermoplasmatota archaeon]MBU4071972.1 50S ribosomal protein L3 [Candidatus Thermoplasmatota archaeon]MBU4144186.1 50S ribosomal protein L3 [Candidatus Thermoplasmatota archaeon]MBU4592820.1 50S ribosomal protein L3 [Candidatus Thermoplasmatota archaeon]
MGKTSRPKRGSRGYSPRKRAKSEVPKFSSWPECQDGPRIQGFAGYKAGMTHAFMTDYRPTSTTAGQEVQVPVTVLETPPMRVVAVRYYGREHYGMRCLGELWAKKLDKDLARRKPLPKNNRGAEVKDPDIEEVRVLMHTIPRMVTGIPKKVPELMEIRIGGGTVQERMEYAKSLLGKDITVNDYMKPGQMIDVAAITTGYGFQGHTKRWGVKLLSHKNSKHRRMIGTLGPKSPKYVRPTVPQAGQMGYHQRTEYNKRVLKIGAPEDEITPAGGFLHYGKVVNQYVILHGSVPGPVKRLIRIRDATRYTVGVTIDQPELIYISRESKQGA